MNETRPVILAIGGSDSAAMAGIQMDLRVAQAFACHAATAISANTAQNSRGVLSINPVPDAVFADQLRACRELRPRAVKVGLLVTAAQVRQCAALVRDLDVPLVVDPVLASSSGAPFVGNEVIACLKRELLPLAALATPNLPEAEILSGLRIRDAEEVIRAARGLRPEAGTVVLKGGHGLQTRSSDYCQLPQRAFWLVSERQHRRNTRATGCAFASAAASALALGYGLVDALVIAKMAVNQGLRQGYGCSDQAGPVNIDHFPAEGIDLPVLADAPGGDFAGEAFPDCGLAPLGLYPVVDSSAWVERLLPMGVTTIQLRIKGMTQDVLYREVRSAVAAARRYDARLFINDHWRLALEAGAYGVHLGQEDLDSADLHAIRRSGLRLGISTHCHYEVARAIGFRPSYLACGPVYATTSKQMPWVPHQLPGLSYWRRVLADHPLVAIGGIDGERLPGVAATGVDGIAMISAITRAQDPDATTRDFIRLCREHRP